MKTLDQQLLLRASLIAEACSGRIGNYFKHYRHKSGLYVDSWHDDRVSYRTQKGANSTLVLSSVQPSKIKDTKKGDLVKLNERTIDAASITVNNQNRMTPRPWGPYHGEFEEIVTKRDAFENSFNQSIRDCFTAGNDASPVKNELEVTVGFSQTTTEENENSKRELRSFEFDGETEAGIDEEIYAWQKRTKMKQVITGHGDYEHSVEIGNHDHGHWGHHKEKWDTFADFMRVIKGDAPTNYALADSFRRHPVDGNLVKALEKPLNMPYTQVLEFEDATEITLGSKELAAADWLIKQREEG